MATLRAWPLKEMSRPHLKPMHTPTLKLNLKRLYYHRQLLLNLISSWSPKWLRSRSHHHPHPKVNFSP